MEHNQIFVPLCPIQIAEPGFIYSPYVPIWGQNFWVVSEIDGQHTDRVCAFTWQSHGSVRP